MHSADQSSLSPLLSIIVPVYNSEKYVKQAIVGLLKQTYSDFEILICDDCSSDRTYEVIDAIKDPRIRLFRNQTNLGKNKTCLFLLDQSVGEYISVHDADDISLPDRFEKQMDFLLLHPEYVLCGTNFISFLDNGKVIDKSSLETDAMKIREKIAKESQFHGPTIVFRKDILPSVGGFYRYFTRAEDIDLTMRIAEKYNTINLAQHLYLYRHVNTSLTNNIYGYSIERWGHAKLLYFLANERRENQGIDSIMKGDYATIDNAMNEFTIEYRKDPTIAFRKGVFRLLGMRMYKNAVQLSWRALRQDMNMLNIKCFIYAWLASIRGKLELTYMNEKVDLDFLNQP